MSINIISDITNISSDKWNNINIDSHPFTSHEFLSALEMSKSVCSDTGWLPQHISLEQDGSVVGALPLYLKFHSYGEYVFDHGWANAYEKAIGNYYPKLISAIPFTPVNGPRFLFNQNFKNLTIETISKAIINLTTNNNFSSAHINFLQNESSNLTETKDWIRRTGLQFHWTNENYNSFEDFLKRLKSSKRKMIKKERDSINQSNLKILKITGDDLNSKIWDQFYRFYLNTIDRKWGGAYLNREFFELISEKMSKKILLIIAKKDQELIAGALNFIGEKTLYGRNWGSLINIPYLHFELCYYQAIEFAIEKKIRFVEAGAQGPHKIKRGYLATPTYSFHFMPNHSFKEAVKKSINEETKYILKEIKYVNEVSNPYNIQQINSKK